MLLVLVHFQKKKMKNSKYLQREDKYETMVGNAHINKKYDNPLDYGTEMKIMQEKVEEAKGIYMQAFE